MDYFQQQTRALAKAAYRLIASIPPLPAAITRFNQLRYRHRPVRRLEIGPGSRRIPGFETLNIVPGPGVDYVADAARRLPFPDGTFDLIYASHILEHIPWYQTLATLREWTRTLKPGGALEVWVPDGLKICETLVRFEREGINEIERDGWYRFNPEQDPCKWAAGRLYTYGDGSGRLDHPNWHRSLFTPRYLHLLLQRAGLIEIRPLSRAEVRGADHGWINLGYRGVRPPAGRRAAAGAAAAVGPTADARASELAGIR
ncbi:MAG TPA: methyltransferase domain-containing protein [Methylomirabilota bacterium]|nr:methyltransferase domain-containing protein [Methylomirabilota bacterium]